MTFSVPPETPDTVTKRHRFPYLDVKATPHLVIELLNQWEAETQELAADFTIRLQPRQTRIWRDAVHGIGTFVNVECQWPLVPEPVDDEYDSEWDARFNDWLDSQPPPNWELLAKVEAVMQAATIH